jgi:hypothetical protein
MFILLSFDIYKVRPVRRLIINMVGSALYTIVFLSIGVIGAAVIKMWPG